MTPTPTVTYTTPDRVERLLRFTLGARKRIAEAFGSPNLPAILNQYGDGALPAIAYAMMYDANGDPPKGLALKAFEEALDGPDDSVMLQAAIMSAMSKGAVPKNELESLLKEQRDQAIAKLIGSISGASQGGGSDSPTLNSGGSPSENSTPSASDTGKSEESADTAPD